MLTVKGVLRSGLVYLNLCILGRGGETFTFVQLAPSSTSPVFSTRYKPASATWIKTFSRYELLNAELLVKGLRKNVSRNLHITFLAYILRF